MTQDGLLLDLGLRDYGEVWGLQQALVERRHGDLVPDALILVEHPPVYTLGRRADPTMALPAGVPRYAIERGGDVTFHGPGQLVGYPIVRLDRRGLDVRGYVNALEDALVDTLGEFGVAAGRGPQTGVWVGGRKVASIGVAVRRWVTFHGFALNVNVDLEPFRRINPCGLPGETMTSMEALLGHGVPMASVRSKVGRLLGEVLGLQWTPTSLEALRGLGIGAVPPEATPGAD